MFILTIIVFVALLLVLVMAHEFGHLITAWLAGCRVEEFAFGFPPRLLSWQRGETRYSLNLLPIGGFVKIEGEDMQETKPGPRSFGSKSAGWRVLILSAGVLMNVVLAAALLMWQAGIGYPVVVTDQNAHQLVDTKTYILDVAANSPAGDAGLMAYDRITGIGDITNPTLDDVQRVIQAHAGSELTVAIERSGQHQTLTVTPRVSPPPGEGAVGISLAATGLTKVPWWQAPWAGIKRTGQMMVAIVAQFGIVLNRLAHQGLVSDTLTGPIGIAIYTNEAAQQGLSYLLEFAALISLNLAIINILPLPALDGGRILFVAIEKIIGRRVPGKIEQVTHTVGFALLIALMIAITWRDVQRFF